MSYHDIDPEQLVAHVRALHDRSEVLDSVRERAERGLAFSKQEMGYVIASTNMRHVVQYWQGKIDAYTAILDVIG